MNDTKVVLKNLERTVSFYFIRVHVRQTQKTVGLKLLIQTLRLATRSEFVSRGYC